MCMRLAPRFEASKLMIVADDCTRDAELHRYTEHMAAITTQRAWRGFVVRKRMETLQ